MWTLLAACAAPPADPADSASAPPADTADTATPPHPWAGSWEVAAAWCAAMEWANPIGLRVEVTETGGDFELTVDLGSCVSSLYLEPAGDGWRGFASGCGNPADLGVVTITDDGDLLVEPELTGWTLGLECPTHQSARLTRP